jgi:hypothetical protein
MSKHTDLLTAKPLFRIIGAEIHLSKVHIQTRLFYSNFLAGSNFMLSGVSAMLFV